MYENLQERINRSTMGMAASQGRLLFMTARISNNEFEQQCVAYSKQRLADDSQTANDRYLEALQATQYQILSGYNGESPNYEPVTYNQLTSLNSVAVSKQYIVSDNKNQIVVTKKIAEAFDKNYFNDDNKLHTNYDFNTFLKNVGNLTQVEKANVTETDVHDAWDKYFVSINRGHEDGIYYDASSKLDGKHVLGFSFHDNKGVSYASYEAYSIIGKNGAKNQIFLNEASDNSMYYNNIPVEIEPYRDDNGEVAYLAKFDINKYLLTANEDDEILNNMMDDGGYVYLDPEIYEVTETGISYIVKDGEAVARNSVNDGDTVTIESFEVPIYVDADFGSLKTPKFTNSETTKANTTPEAIIQNIKPIFYEGTTAEQRELYDYAMAITEKYATGNELEYDADKVQYYKNIYQQMITNGYTTFDKMVKEEYINTMTYNRDSGLPSEVSKEDDAFKSDNWLINLLKNGKLSISYYNSNEKDFVGTTLDDDESIVEKENKSKIALAEQVYQTHMDRIEREDKQFDMQLTKLESEHTALTTEYESVTKIISKNVEKSFNVFNA